MPERLSRATRAAPVGARPPLGQEQHNLSPSSPARDSRHPPRACLRKGCGRRFLPRRWNQRYCPDAECRRLLRRWQDAKRQQRRRSRADVRQQQAAAEKQRRAEVRAAGGSPRRRACLAPPPVSCSAAESASCSSAPQPATGSAPEPARSTVQSALVAGAWSRRRTNSDSFCDRPGCYEPLRVVHGASARYCGDLCCQVQRRVRDRERKWLRRKTSAGRFKRLLEYQARRAARKQRREQAASAVAPPPRAAVLDYSPQRDSLLSCRDAQEVAADDPETRAGPRPRAPPAS